jgi:chromosome segregation ATPase
MAEDSTQNMNGSRPFEERVFARFDALDSAIRHLDSRVESLDSRVESLDSRVESLDSRVENLDSRVQKLEVRAYDTKPIWEQALKEIVETRRELSRRLDRIEGSVLETRADLRDAEDRIEKLESKPTQ